MRKMKAFLSIFITDATVFFSSACIMTLEIVAGRLIARYLGSSLYTWTSVIGVVLAGITIGNYLGGRIADRYNAAKTLSVLFTLSSIACVLVVVSNNLVNQWILLWEFNWPVRVFTHVSLVFFIPSMLLGTISPVVAKMALDRKLATGRTVGDIYAAGAAGSILGTFLAGFYLIAMMGTIAIVWGVAAALLLMAVLYRPRYWGLYVWAAIFIALVAMAMAPVEWVGSVGASVGLREKHDPDIIYEDESQYGYIAVRQLSKNPDQRQFTQDNSKNQSTVVMDNIRDLKFAYPRIFAALTHSLSKGKEKLSTLMIGGGGHVYPRYVMEFWPGSHVDVVEIDHAVTKAAILAFGFPADSAINVVNMDARNYLSDLIRKQAEGKSVQLYDFIYGDAFTDYAIPYHLTTKEFNDNIAAVLKDDGVYMLNVIDVCQNGRFLRSVVGTFRKTFPFVCILAEVASRYEGGNFVVVGSKRKLDLDGINQHEMVRNLALWVSTDAEIEQLKEKTGTVVLTDDYAPAENLLLPFAQQKASFLLGEQYLEQAKALSAEHRWDESIANYRAAAKVLPKTNLQVHAYIGMGGILAQLGRWEEAIEVAKTAIECNDRAAVKQSMSFFLYNIHIALNQTGRRKEANEYLYKAIQAYKEDLTREPYSATIAVKLGSALVEAGNFDEAIEQLQNTITYMSEHNQTQDAVKLQQYLELVETEKKKQK
ncbi:MAG: fused MFS/spermidine synthase [Phycisphaerae bacterium]|nr:fused MFS/spermidine synthase [Phycisphaerae bacterium]